MANPDIFAIPSSLKCGSADFMKNRRVQCAFVLSCTALAALVPYGHSTIPILVVGLIAAFSSAAVITFRFSFLEKIFDNVVRWQLILAIVFTIVAAFNFYDNFCRSFHRGIELGILPNKFEGISTFVHVVAGFTATAAVPAAFVFLYGFINRFLCRSGRFRS